VQKRGSQAIAPVWVCTASQLAAVLMVALARVDLQLA